MSRQRYFAALSIPVLRGRIFHDRDTPGAAPVVIVNAAFAKKYLPGADPIGQRITIGKGLGPEFEDPTRRSSGLSATSRDNGLDADAPPMVYVPVAQVSDALTQLANGLIPASLDHARPSRRRVAAAADSEGVPRHRRPAARRAGAHRWSEVVATSIAQQNFNMLLLTIFGAIALLLAAIGDLRADVVLGGAGRARHRRPPGAWRAIGATFCRWCSGRG